MKSTKTRAIRVGSLKIGFGPLFLIAGPCVIESASHPLKIARRLKEITDELEIPFIFKASYDKANRSSIGSFRGVGMERGLDILDFSATLRVRDCIDAGRNRSRHRRGLHHRQAHLAFRHPGATSQNRRWARPGSGYEPERFRADSDRA